MSGDRTVVPQTEASVKPQDFLAAVGAVYNLLT